MRKPTRLTILVITTGCALDNAGGRIGFDLETLNDEGFYGRVSGLKALDYEFCIPDDKNSVDEVASLDPSVHCSRTTGRIGYRIDQTSLSWKHTPE